MRVLAMLVGFAASCALDTTALQAAKPRRTWTIYIAQDKHLDYNWCGTTTEIEMRMVALVDFYLAQAEQKRGRWNLDGTLWADVYLRRRRDEGLAFCIEPSASGDSAAAAAYDSRRDQLVMVTTQDTKDATVEGRVWIFDFRLHLEMIETPWLFYVLSTWDFHWEHFS